MAYEDETKLDKILIRLGNKVIQDFKDMLEDLAKQGKLDLDSKVNLANHPNLFRALKEIERQSLQKLTEYYWIGQQIMEETMAKTYREATLQTYAIYNKTVPDLKTKVYLKDNYIQDNILSKPWCQDGKIYKERLYSHTLDLQNKLAFILEQGVQKGRSLDQMEKLWRKALSSTAYDTARLMKTEVMAMWSQATKSTLLEIGVEYVEIVGDAECGGICLDYVGEAIALRDAEIGDLLPPYHPNCACSYVEYIEDVEMTPEELENTEDFDE